MRAVVCSAFGPPEALTLSELPPAELRPGQVRIRVEAAGVNFVDALMVQGLYQIKPPLPYVPGGEGVGVVSELGPDVTDRALGDRVVFSAPRAFATEVVAPAAGLVPAPPGLTVGQAGSFVQSYLTAWFALVERARLAAGSTLLVLGAGGGVGLAAVDLARALGITVVAAASTPEKLELARARGAAHLVDTTRESVKDRVKELTEGRGVDAAYDPVGGALAEQALRALGEDGQLLVIGFAAGEIPRLPANQVLLRNRRVTGVDLGGWVARRPGEAARMLASLGEHLATGTLDPVEPTAYPLAETGRALRDLLDRKVAGKAVVTP